MTKKISKMHIKELKATSKRATPQLGSLLLVLLVA